MMQLVMLTCSGQLTRKDDGSASPFMFLSLATSLSVVQPGQRRVVVAECKFHPGQVGTGQADTSQLPLFRGWSRRFAGTEH